MIVNWFISIFNLLGLELPSMITILGINMSLNTLILINFIVLMSFFIIEISIGVHYLFKKIYRV